MFRLRPSLIAAATLALVLGPAAPAGRADNRDPRVTQIITRGLEWVASTQSRLGSWSANNGAYPTAMTALAGIALMCEGSTTTQGKYSKNIRLAVDYLIAHSRTNGLIGNPPTANVPNGDDRYTYGHGYAMLFLSQVLGEEEDLDRRKELIDVLTKAVTFTCQAQTRSGGWGYVSARDGSDFDEGSTTITQVQALRSCRNAGIPVPKEAIESAVAYIRHCTGRDGGVIYRAGQGGPGRPAITAAAIACLFNAGEYDSDYVPRMQSFCKGQLGDINNQGFGHWHYAHYYYAQVMYRMGGDDWDNYRDKLYRKITTEATESGKYIYWPQGSVGPIYATAVNLTVLQLENGALPIYQR